MIASPVVAPVLLCDPFLYLVVRHSSQHLAVSNVCAYYLS